MGVDCSCLRQNDETDKVSYDYQNMIRNPVQNSANEEAYQPTFQQDLAFTFQRNLQRPKLVMVRGGQSNVIPTKSHQQASQENFEVTPFGQSEKRGNFDLERVSLEGVGVEGICLMKGTKSTQMDTSKKSIGLDPFSEFDKESRNDDEFQLENAQKLIQLTEQCQVHLQAMARGYYIRRQTVLEFAKFRKKKAEKKNRGEEKQREGKVKIVKKVIQEEEIKVDFQIGDIIDGKQKRKEKFGADLSIEAKTPKQLKKEVIVEQDPPKLNGQLRISQPKKKKKEKSRGKIQVEIGREIQAKDIKKQKQNGKIGGFQVENQKKKLKKPRLKSIIDTSESEVLQQQYIEIKSTKKEKQARIPNIQPEMEKPTKTKPKKLKTPRMKQKKAKPKNYTHLQQYFEIQPSKKEKQSRIPIIQPEIEEPQTIQIKTKIQNIPKKSTKIKNAKIPAIQTEYQLDKPAQLKQKLPKENSLKIQQKKSYDQQPQQKSKKLSKKHLKQLKHQVIFQRSLQFSPQLNSPKYSQSHPKTNPLSQQLLQSAFKGFIERQSILPKFRTYQSNKIPLPEFDYTSFLKLDSVFDGFNLEKPLQDSIPVQYFPKTRLSDGTIYQGDWDSSGNRHGRGTQISPDGTLYQGYFIKGQKHVFGRLIKADGTAYQGHIKKNQYQGDGLYRNSQGTLFKAKFINNLPNGSGYQLQPDGVLYEGEFLDGKRHGKGVLKLKDGSKFEGQFVGGMINGFGCFEWVNKKKYEGEWKEGRMHGKGTLVNPDGSIYTGEFVNDSKVGYGEFLYADGKKYVGKWNNNQFDGEGELTTIVNGRKIERKGVWSRGKIVSWEKK